MMPVSATKSPAWVSPLLLHRNACVPQFRGYTRHNAVTPRSILRRNAPHMTAKGVQPLQLVTVPDESHMVTPGEVRHVSLDYSLFQTILQSGTTTFGILNIDDWFSHRGCVLSILNIRNLSPDPSPRVEVECRCPGRFDITTNSSAPPAWTLLSIDCSPVSDWPVYEAQDRQALADAEWRVWTGCREVADLMRRVASSAARVGVEQELAVWAPKEYDRKISPEEWAATPIATRHGWCERAESFSFGVLRCMQASESVMARARAITSTLERLELGMEAVELRRARTMAEISLRDVFS